MASKNTVSLVFTGAATKTTALTTPLDENVITGFFFPAAWSTADVTFEVSPDGATYYPVKKSDGTNVTLTACAASTFVAVAPTEMAWAGQFVKLVSSVSQTDKTVLINAVRTY